MLWKCPDCKKIQDFEQKCNCGYFLASFEDAESLILTEEAINNHTNQQIPKKDRQEIWECD